MDRLVIAGGPRVGKTTHALRLFDARQEADMQAGKPIRVFHTDEVIHLGWSEASDAASLWFDEEGPWIVEGVAAPRALRKWLRRHPTSKPCDAVLWMGLRAFEPLTQGQVTMGRGALTVWQSIAPELRARGVQIVWR